MITGQLQYKQAECQRVRVFVTIESPTGEYVGLQRWYGRNARAIHAAVQEKYPKHVLGFGIPVGVD